MTDRELLERAAKAVGGKLSEGTGHRRTGPTWDAWEWYGPIGIAMPDGSVSYPLTDDGDALRLAVALKMDLLRADDCIEAQCGELIEHDGQELCAFGIEPLGDDLAAATRRAIVRAAAALSRAPGA